MIKVIDSIQYHVWTDALHARELARRTESPYDRGAYVRWAIQTAWSAFENVCMDALEAPHLGMRFRQNFDEAVANKGLAPVDWGQGLWQQVMAIYSMRIAFVHVVPGISHERLLTPLKDAERAIAVLRDGIREVSNLAGVPYPVWSSDDEDRGWQGGKVGSGAKVGVTADACIVRKGVDENDPEAVRIMYVLREHEHLTEIAPPGTPHEPLLDHLAAALNIPVDAIRAYRGATLLEDRKLNARV